MDKYKDEATKIEAFIDDNAKTQVGVLLKRLEILEVEQLTPIQIKSIFKSIVKETIYENSRTVKAFVRTILEVGTIIFTNKSKESK